MTVPPTISTTGTRRERPLVDVANTRFPRSGRGSPRPAVLHVHQQAPIQKTPVTVKRQSPAEFSLQSVSLNGSVSDVEALGTGTPAPLTPPAKAPTVPAPASAAPVATVVAPDSSVSATPQASPFEAASAQAGVSGGTAAAVPDFAPAQTDTTAPTPPRRISRATRSSARSIAVPFPTISEETFDMQCDPSPVPFYNYTSSTELARGREWEKEVARRQENIKELRDRKIRLEQVHQTRPRKTSPSPTQSAASGSYSSSRTPTYSYLTSLERKFTTDDIEFISVLHSSVVWRLWHVDLSPEIFASERMLATRLHLVLMRYGKKDIPVPPIVALSKNHLIGHNSTRGAAFSALGGGGVMGGFGKKPIMEKEKKGIQSLEQLVAKSLLRKGEGSGRSSRGRRMVITYGYPVNSGEGYAMRGSVGRARARREATSPLAVSW